MPAWSCLWTPASYNARRPSKRVPTGTSGMSPNAIPPPLLVEPARASNLAPKLERLPELHADLSPRLRAPSRVQHHAQHAVDAEPRVPEAGVVDVAILL